VGIFNHIIELLQHGESFVLTTIISRSGSAPRDVGTRMLVRSDGPFIGTIGGGILEARVLNLAKEAFGHKGALVKQFVLTAEDAEQMGMICGGQLRVLIQYVEGSDPANLAFYRQVEEILDQGKQACLITQLPAGKTPRKGVMQCLFRHDGTHAATVERPDIRELVHLTQLKEPEVASQGGTHYLVEPMCLEGVVVIFGAGHISQELAALTSRIGFRTLVLDDRQEFANRERFPLADQVIVLDSFEHAMQGLDIDANSYIVIVTRGHAHDGTILRKALQTQAGYIGMIGSRRKRDAIYEAMRKEGFTAEMLQRVYSPIGLNIGAETPAEIAVSITAELVQARAQIRHIVETKA
jgi:xanthine dehydrogenase accessory factor